MTDTDGDTFSDREEAAVLGIDPNSSGDLPFPSGDIFPIGAPNGVVDARDALETTRISPRVPSGGDSDGDGITDGADPEPLQGVTYRHPDHLGSRVVVTRADSTELTRVVYCPYGQAVLDATGKAPSVPVVVT